MSAQMAAPFSMNPTESPQDTEDDPLIQLCTVCDAAIDISDEDPLTEIACPTCGAQQYVSGSVDKFDLQQEVGRGGMGVVYRAYDSGLDRFVALKLLRRDQSNRLVVEQFAREAAITASINHPHVVRVYTSGTDHGRFFIAMELVDKGTLDDLIHLQGRVAEAQVLEVGIQIAQGLRAALGVGLIHRDVKPGNILFSNAHTAKIVDFGLAILQADEESQRGEIWGTPYYVAPEKLDHKPEDFRSDMYSLGGTLFHALAGRPPFEAENASLVALKHLKSQAVSLQAFAPQVSSETAYVINRTLEKNPNNRYQSYDELIEHLQYALDQLRAHGGQVPAKKRLVIEGAEQQRLMGWVTAGMVGLILLAAGGLFAFRKQIFPGGSTASVASPAPGKTAAAGPLTAARKRLVDGDTAGAIELLRQDGANPKLPPLQRAWANVGEGIAHFIAGDAEAARQPLQAAVDRPQFKSKGEDEKTDFYLRELARDLLTPAPVAAGAARGLDLKTRDALTVFAYGAKDWALGKIDDSTELLRQFRSAEPAPPHAWITELRPVATNLLAAQAAFAMAADELKKAKRLDKYNKALASLRNLKGPLVPVVAQFVKKFPAPKPVNLPKLGAWTQTELGTPDVVPESAVDAAGVFTLRAGGNDLWGAADSGLYVQQQLKGDGEIVARVVSATKTDPMTKAGIMIRENLRGDARNVALVALAGGGLSQQFRVAPGGPTAQIRTNGGTSFWLKLTRNGDEITGSVSADGDTWKLVKTTKLPKLSAEVFVGLVLSARSPTQAATARIDQVKLTPAPAP